MTNRHNYCAGKLKRVCFFKEDHEAFSFALSDLATYQIGFFNRDTFNGQQSPFTKTKTQLEVSAIDFFTLNRGEQDESVRKHYATSI
jgi:hypothetical protein